MGQFGPLAKRQSHTPNVDLSVLSNSTRRLPRALSRDWVPKPGRVRLSDYNWKLARYPTILLSRKTIHRIVLTSNSTKPPKQTDNYQYMTALTEFRMKF